MLSKVFSIVSLFVFSIHKCRHYLWRLFLDASIFLKHHLLNFTSFCSIRNNCIASFVVAHWFQEVSSLNLRWVYFKEIIEYTLYHNRWCIMHKDRLENLEKFWGNIWSGRPWKSTYLINFKEDWLVVFCNFSDRKH